MKRFHVHVSVENIHKSIEFYSGLFASPPSVRKSDYAKWMLEDPRVNFAISCKGSAPGIEHLGIQVESEAELGEVQARLAGLVAPVVEEKGATCCYAKSEKAWVADPEGIAWETFLTVGEATTYGDSRPALPTKARSTSARVATSCCAPAKTVAPSK